MQPQPVNTLPLDVRYICTETELESLVLMGTWYAEAEIEEGLQNGISKSEMLEKIEVQVSKLLKKSLEKKIEKKEVTTFTNSLLDARVQTYQVDPINEVLNVHYELMFMRFLFNEMVTSEEKFKTVINEDCFKRAREFAAQQMHAKFPFVNQVPAKIVEEGKPEEPQAPETPKEPTE